MKKSLNKNKIDNPDDFYEVLIAAHEGLSEEESRQLNSRLILLLSNTIGDIVILKKLIKVARDNLRFS
ncbi:MAG: hypothetical protein CMM58_05070 [Rhodospirillaceae bacterium]|nr:hypothetical protein [Rhodospirillaceae bacterium]